MRNRDEPYLAGLRGTVIPGPSDLEPLKPQLLKYVSALRVGAFLFSVFLSMPLQMGQLWEMHQCTLLALGLAGLGHCHFEHLSEWFHCSRILKPSLEKGTGF